MKLLSFLLLTGVALAAAKPTVFFIRHGEKPPSHDNPTLSPKGKKRAQCIRSVFGDNSNFDIGYIMAETPKKSGFRQRPFDTVAPLASDLGLEIDTSCGKKDIDCVRDAVENYEGKGNILICWEHKRIKKIAKALGARHVKKYPKYAFDLIWIDPYPYDEIVDIISEDCPGLDD
ncbi:phosphoglycerate mutase family protein [Hirsutella rhossiliensis]|uniref:Phosphoglycerate mutase family protein n=1 Tax=Hirsutella rhossiliensis TaxID=111463 RepID=A0A9P8MR25_9HYPO|nr:phosphoglycerate mutase family protein [Hirsutella rhossiliensis]KAH0958919.1 phosphoglycerate mutase family protein [Hirsutella rhossiliensis]